MSFGTVGPYAGGSGVGLGDVGDGDFVGAVVGDAAGKVGPYAGVAGGGLGAGGGVFGVGGDLK
ncbi:hypothetical protein AGMMS50222_09420 [Endomicrobiia bacterium]|nr:hypothetical protein AGMMS50222_09420 [Endomicrobiia bacterium]